MQEVDLAQLEKEAYGPHGNPDHYLSSIDLERGFSELNPAPAIGVVLKPSFADMPTEVEKRCKQQCFLSTKV